jgi:hypothetical protein
MEESRWLMSWSYRVGVVRTKRRWSMTNRMEHRYEVTFTASEALDGRPVITLVLDQEGQTAAGQDNIFFLDVDQTVAQDGIHRIAALLTQYVKGFGVMTRTPQGTQDPSELNEGNGISVCRQEVLEEDAAPRGEPEANPEEEGQPIPPLQIDGVKEGEAEEPRSQSEKGGGPIQAEES